MREQGETIEESMERSPVKENDAPAVSIYPEGRTGTLITPQTGCGACGNSGGATGPSLNDAGMNSYVYAIGRIEPRFPNLGAEKEFAQATKAFAQANKATNTPGKTINSPSTTFYPSPRTDT